MSKINLSMDENVMLYIISARPFIEDIYDKLEEGEIDAVKLILNAVLIGAELEALENCPFNLIGEE